MRLYNGKRYGMLTVIAERAYRSKAVLCRCDCGIEKMVRTANLDSGATTSCGCLKAQLTSQRFRTHGTGYEDYRYRLWRSIKKKCLTPTHQDYPYYGGRGITVYPEWATSFEAFSAYLDENLGPRPEGMTLDRVNNDGNYEPGNIRWATRQQQALNRRNRYRTRSIEDGY